MSFLDWSFLRKDIVHLEPIWGNHFLSLTHPASGRGIYDPSLGLAARLAAQALRAADDYPTDPEPVPFRSARRLMPGEYYRDLPTQRYAPYRRNAHRGRGSNRFHRR